LRAATNEAAKQRNTGPQDEFAWLLNGLLAVGEKCAKFALPASSGLHIIEWLLFGQIVLPNYSLFMFIYFDLVYILGLGAKEQDAARCFTQTTPFSPDSHILVLIIVLHPQGITVPRFPSTFFFAKITDLITLSVFARKG
jgi:hypothetical protein